MEIKQNIRNDLVKRNEIFGVLHSEANPGFASIKKLVSEQTKKPEEAIDVFSIKGSFGSKKFDIKAYAYDSAEDLKKAEQKTQKQLIAEKKAEEEKKKAEAEAKKAAETPAA
ncbi:MAG: hypothetical protein WC438_03830 [Candidatus Pacearchaeota archaeon]